MALKGPYKFMGEVQVQEAYAVIDLIQMSKEGDGFAHVSIYARLPKETIVDEVVAKVDTAGAAIAPSPPVEEDKIVVLDRGPILEHFTISGISFKDPQQSPFITAYEGIVSDPRLSQMISA